jgi:hypothetical protein
VGYFYRGECHNYYYDVTNGELYCYFRWADGYEDEESEVLMTQLGLSFEQFMEIVKKEDAKRGGY